MRLTRRSMVEEFARKGKKSCISFSRESKFSPNTANVILPQVKWPSISICWSVILAAFKGKCLGAMSSDRRLFTFSSRSECYGLKQEVEVMHIYHLWWSVRSIKQILRIYAQMPGTFKWEKQQRRSVSQHDWMECGRVKLVNMCSLM